MKIKRRPEDFQVEERTDFAPSPGPFALYLLTKESIGTPEAIEAIARRWNLPRQALSFGGLKDRHARTVQYVTIRGGPARDLRQAHLELRFLGRAARPFGPADIRGNAFRIVMRDMDAGETARARKALDLLPRDGAPNYFDDQRFGSVGESGDFAARAWCAEDHERALWLALADPNEHDRPEDRKEKEALRRLWGKWAEAKAALGRSHRRSLVTYLDDRPGDFRGAIARLQEDLRGLLLSAFQSHLWNLLLAERIREACAGEPLVEVGLKMGRFPFFRALRDDQRSALTGTLPLPSARARIEGPVRDRFEAILAPFGLSLEKLKIRKPRGIFFSRGDRAMRIMPAGLEAVEAPDELYPRRRKLALAFELPRGAYATMIVKRLTEAG